MQDIDVAIIAGKSELDAMRSAWEACFDRSDASPYLCFDWYRLYLEHLADPAEVRIAVARIAGEPRAILPLEKARVAVGPVGEDILRFSGDGFAPWMAGILAAGVDAAAALNACLAALRRHDRDWSFMRLAKVPKSAPLAQHFRRSDMPGSVQIVLPETWSRYLEALPGDMQCSQHMPQL